MQREREREIVGKSKRGDAKRVRGYEERSICASRFALQMQTLW